MSFLHKMEQWGAEEFERLKGFFGPVLAQAAAAGVADLEADAADALGRVANDPALATDSARREAAVKAMSERLAAQGKAVSDAALAAAVAAVQAQGAAHAQG